VATDPYKLRARDDHGPLRAIAARMSRSPTLGRWALRAIPDAGWTVRIAPIGPFRITLRKHRSYWLRHPLTHERVMFGALARLVREGDVVWDVGANIGLYTRFMAQAFGAGRVVSFEPMGENRRLLERNVALGRLGDRSIVLPYALSDAEGEADLQVDVVQSGSAALDSVTGGRASEAHEHYGIPARTERVALRRGDALIASGEAPAPDVVKVDIEGAEAMFLRGLGGVLAERRPRVAIELHGLEVSRATLAILGDAGYASWAWVRRGEGGRAWERVTPATVDGLARKYDLHHVFAVPEADAASLASPPEPWTG
jgi:FkbM family methyltransferase